MADAKEHWLAEILRWSPATRLEASQVLAAMLGLAGPILLGVATDHLRLGMAAAIGGLALDGTARGESLGREASALTGALISGCAAIWTGTSLVGSGSLIIAVPAIAAVAGLLGGISRPLARESTRFIRFTIIAANLSAPEIGPFGVTLLFFLGGAWTLGLSLLLRLVFAQARRVAQSAAARPPRPSAGPRLRRWLGSLSTLPGWQYPLRIALCLAVAEAVAWIWPGPHGQWIALTVAIVLDRRPATPPTRLVQRALGTVLGVILASLLLIRTPSILIVTIAIAALAAMRPVLRAGNYTAYAAIMTPLIVLLVDFGETPSAEILLDRLLATIAGCLIALLFGYLPWLRVLSLQSGQPTPNPGGGAPR